MQAAAAGGVMHKTMFSKFIYSSVFLILIGCSTQSNVISDVSADQNLESLTIYRDKGWYISDPLTVEEIEKEAMEERVQYSQQPNARKDIPMVPFGFSNNYWEEFKSQIQPGDEIRFLSTPQKSWENLAGWQGYALVRSGYVVTEMTTLVN